jgi:hypothetical protein
MELHAQCAIRSGVSPDECHDDAQLLSRLDAFPKIFIPGKQISVSD